MAPRRLDLRRIRIDVVETLEAERIFDVAEGRDAVAPFQSVRCGLRMRRFNRGKDGVEAQRRSHRGSGGALQEMSSCDRQMRFPVAETALLRTQYKARVRQITLLFPHDINRASVGAEALSLF